MELSPITKLPSIKIGVSSSSESPRKAKTKAKPPQTQKPKALSVAGDDSPDTVAEGLASAKSSGKGKKPSKRTCVHDHNKDNHKKPKVKQAGTTMDEDGSWSAHRLRHGKAARERKLAQVQAQEREQAQKPRPEHVKKYKFNSTPDNSTRAATKTGAKPHNS